MRKSLALTLLLAVSAGCASGPKTRRGGIIGAAVGGAAGALIGREMDKRAEQLAQDLKDARVSRVGEGIVVTFESGILFPFDSAELLPESRRNLHKLALSLEEEPKTDVMIVGHTDDTGSDSYNRDLSERRARSAAAFLRGDGVASRRLQPTGRGESEPIESNATEEGRQQNRRVEIAIYANRQWRAEAQRETGGE